MSGRGRGCRPLRKWAELMSSLPEPYSGQFLGLCLGTTGLGVPPGCSTPHHCSVSAVLGLALQAAWCHNHDLGIFTSTDAPYSPPLGDPTLLAHTKNGALCSDSTFPQGKSGLQRKSRYIGVVEAMYAPYPTVPSR